MTGVDTNVLVRILTDDDPEQARRARRALVALRRRGDAAWISIVVLCELVWVLTAGYGYQKPELGLAIRELLDTEGFVVEDAEHVASALRGWEAGRGDLADHIIGGRNLAVGCRKTLTFDKALLKEPGFAGV